MATGWSADERARVERLEAGETICVSMRRGAHPHLISWAMDRGLFVRIDRKSKWGNPFVLGPDGDRDTVIRRYHEEHLQYQPSLLTALDELRGKALGCWCAPDRCHGDVLANAVGAAG
jgi:hypothetical protein